MYVCVSEYVCMSVIKGETLDTTASAEYMQGKVKRKNITICRK